MIIVILIIIIIIKTSYLFRWVLEALSSGVKLPGREADHSLLSRMQRTILLLHHNIFIARYVTKNMRDSTCLRLNDIKNRSSNNKGCHLKYRVIHKSLREFRTRLRNNQDRHGRKEHINR